MITERIDHTLLRADATEEDIRGLCEEAVTYGFHSVCVNSSCVALCASLLKNTGIKVCTVIGFPLGAMSTTAKIAEATAEGIKRINEANPSAEYLALEGFKSLEKVADGQSTKIVVPTDIANVTGLLASLKDTIANDKKK